MSSIQDIFDLACHQHQAGNFAQAEQLYRQVLQADPYHVDANTKLGLVHYHQGNFSAAAASFQHVQRIKPQDASANFNLGLALHRAGRVGEAIAAYQKALTLQPNLIAAWNNLGSAFRGASQLDDAVACYRNALQAKPDHPEAHVNLANVLAEQGKIDEALACYRLALGLRSDNPETHYNLGLALEKAGRLEDAATSLQHAVTLNPERLESQFSLGIVLQELGELDGALASYNEVLRLDPAHAKAHQNRACIWLQRGDWEHGWPEYEYRWQTENFPRYFFPKPRWNGSPLNGRTLLLVAEQGLGDTLQFIRLAVSLKKLGEKVTVVCQRPLQRLLADSLGADTVASLGGKLPQFDVHAPLLSVPGLLNITPATVPADIPYLRADADLVTHWRESLAPLKGLKVGIAWQGNPTIGDHRRCFPLTQFACLARLPGVNLISLQKGAGAEQLQELGKQFNVLDLSDRLDESSGPFRDTAAIMKNLDLVISSDTAVPHLAGALGVPVWVALRHAPDWRWLLGREDSPWYPTMRLFRQARAGDWNDVFERMATELRAGSS